MREFLQYLKYLLGASVGGFLFATGLEMVDVTYPAVGWTLMVLGLVVMVFFVI